MIHTSLTQLFIRERICIPTATTGSRVLRKKRDFQSICETNKKSGSKEAKEFRSLLICCRVESVRSLIQISPAVISMRARASSGSVKNRKFTADLRGLTASMTTMQQTYAVPENRTINRCQSMKLLCIKEKEKKGKHVSFVTSVNYATSPSRVIRSRSLNEREPRKLGRLERESMPIKRQAIPFPPSHSYRIILIATWLIEVHETNESANKIETVTDSSYIMSNCVTIVFR